MGCRVTSLRGLMREKYMARGVDENCGVRDERTRVG